MLDNEFIFQFENCTLPKTDFHHREHVRIVWLYLSRYPLDEAMEKTIQGIIRYATSLGAAHIYHETMTRAWVLVVKSAMNQSFNTFDEFIQSNPHLLDKNLLSEYYSSTLLNSDEARKTWLDPDLKNILFD